VLEFLADGDSGAIKQQIDFTEFLIAKIGKTDYRFLQTGS